jgi:Contractile injection system tube protein/LysM domain
VAFQQVTLKRWSKDAGDPLTVVADYNPAELTFNKTVQLAEVAIPGLDNPLVQFVRGGSDTLAFDLFFDTTDDGSPVTTKTQRLYELVKVDPKTHAPPVLDLSWGSAKFPGAPSDGETFRCVAESVRQRFTLFDEQGVPLRATLSVSLRAYRTVDEQVTTKNAQSPDHTKAHVVQQGDTITRIAGAAYEDPSAWRAIADHNDLDDPFDLQPGRVLELPPIT